MAKNADTTPSFSKQLFRGISTAKKLKFCPSDLTETETRAVGVLYMVNLVWATAREQIASPNLQGERLLARILKIGFCLHMLLDESDQMAAYSAGGRVENKNDRFSEARAIVQELVKRNPDLNTKILAQRACTRIEREQPERIPSRRWVEDCIRDIKKYYVVSSYHVNPRLTFQSDNGLG